MGCCASKESSTPDYEKGVVESGSPSSSKLSRNTASRNASSHISLSKKEHPSVSSAGGAYHRRNSQLSSRPPDSPPLKHKRPSRSRSYGDRERERERDHHRSATVRRRQSRTGGDAGEVEVSYTPSRSHSGCDSPNTRHSFSLSHSPSLSHHSNDERRRPRRRRRKNRSAEEHIDFDTPLHDHDDGDDHTRLAGVDESTYFHSQNTLTLTRKSALQDREVPVTSPLAKRASLSGTGSLTHRGSFSARARALTAGSESHFRASKHNLQIRIGDDSTLFTQRSGTGTLLGSKSESLSNALTPPEVMDTDDSDGESSEGSIPDLGSGVYGGGSYHMRSQTYAGFLPPQHDTSTMRRIPPANADGHFRGAAPAASDDQAFLYAQDENHTTESLVTHPFSHDSCNASALSDPPLTNSGKYLAPMHRSSSSNASFLSLSNHGGHGRHHTFSEQSFKSIPSSCNTDLPAFGGRDNRISSLSRERYPSSSSPPQDASISSLPYSSAPTIGASHPSHIQTATENCHSLPSTHEFSPQASHKHIARHATGTSVTSTSSNRSFPTRTRSLSSNSRNPSPHQHAPHMYTHKPGSMSRSKSKSRRRKAAANSSGSPHAAAASGSAGPKSLSRSTQYLHRSSSAQSLSSRDRGGSGGGGGGGGEEFSRSHLSLASSDARAGFTPNSANEISSNTQCPPDNVSEAPDRIPDPSTPTSTSITPSSTAATASKSSPPPTISLTMPAREDTHTSSIANVCLPAHRRGASTDSTSPRSAAAVASRPSPSADVSPTSMPVREHTSTSSIANVSLPAHRSPPTAIVLTMPAREHTSTSSVANVSLPAHRRESPTSPHVSHDASGSQTNAERDPALVTSPRLPHTSTSSPALPPEDDSLSVRSDGENSLFSVSAPSISHVAVAGSPRHRGGSRDDTPLLRGGMGGSLSDLLEEGSELAEEVSHVAGGSTTGAVKGIAGKSSSSTYPHEDEEEAHQGDDTSVHGEEHSTIVLESHTGTSTHSLRPATPSTSALRAATPSTSVSRRSSFDERKDDGEVAEPSTTKSNHFAVGESALYEEDLPGGNSNS